MNSHLAVRIDGQYAALPDDAAIDIEDSNPYFNDTPETWSYSFDLPLAENEALLGNVADIASDRRLVSMENKPMEIYADGIEFRNGKVATTDDQEIKDKVSISMTSINKQLNDIFGDLSLRDIVFPGADMESLQIGEMIGEVAVKGYSRYNVMLSAIIDDSSHIPTGIKHYSEDDDMMPDLRWIANGRCVLKVWNHFDQRILGERVVYPQALGFSTPKEYAIDYSVGTLKKYRWQVARDGAGDPIVNKSFINVEAPYGTMIIQPDGSQRKALYFNSRISYTHHALDADGKSSDTVEYDKGGYGPYYVLDADRPQSGICFYVLYVLRSMFYTIGVTYGNEQEAVLMSVPDMARLGFFTTQCHYDFPPRIPNTSITLDGSDADFPYDKNFDDNMVNLWLSERKTNGRLEPHEDENEDADEVSVTISYYSRFEWNGSRFEIVKDEKYLRTVMAVHGTTMPVEFYDSSTGEMQTFNFIVSGALREDRGSDYKYSARIFKMYANADNLPDMKMSSFVASMWSAFGIKFNYDAKTNVVTPRFIRDILRDKRETIVMPGEAWTIHKNSEKITGFRQHYSAESDTKEQNLFIRKRVTDYDTAYDYQVEKSKDLVVMRTSYYEFSNSFLSVGDETCYVDPVTGNAYRIKISKEALDNGDVNKLQPSLFQVAQWHGVEIGDCSEENSDYVLDISIEFVPVDQNDLNWGRGRHTAKLCPFADDDMWSEKTDMEKQGPIGLVVDSNLTTVYTIVQILSTNEKYDPSSTDDRNSPLASHDWGNAICMMRGGGADGRIDYYDYDYDGYGSSKIRTLAGDYAMDSDSISVYGDEYDYNGGGGENGIGAGERFSLKLRAYHTDPKTGNILCNDPRLAYRGLHDRFMADYAHFVLNRKKITVTGRVNVIDIKNIQWDRKYNIGGVVGWINKISTHISAKKGIETCTFELFVL